MIRLPVFGLLAALTVGGALADDRMATLSLSGSGQLSMAPDIATLYVGVESQADTAAAALAENSRQAGQVIASLKDAGVADRDIQTANFSVSPVYDNRKTLSSGAPAVDGYRVTNQVVATVRDLDGLGALLDRVVSVGANRIGGISFGVEDDGAALDRARALAVEDARHKAEVYAKAAGVSLGPILAMSEGGGYAPPQDFAMRARMAESGAAPVERGQAMISAQVTITWSIASP